MTVDLKFQPISTVDANIKIMISKSIYSMDEGFYKLIFSDHLEAISRIALSLDEVGGDLGCGFVAFDNNIPIGYLGYFPFSQKTTRNLVTLRALLDFGLPSIREHLKKIMSFQSSLAPVEYEGLYLNKLLVFDDFQGKSYGINMFNAYINHAKQQNLQPFFHVRSDNKKAISFYKKAGFTVEDSKFEYLLCAIK